jgi:hypothetical protein
MVPHYMNSTLRDVGAIACMMLRCIRAPPGGTSAVHQRGKRRRKDQCNDSNTPEQVQTLKPPSQRADQLFVFFLP